MTPEDKENVMKYGVCEIHRLPLRRYDTFHMEQQQQVHEIFIACPDCLKEAQK